MEENLDKNNEVNKEISDNTTKSNSEEIKRPKSEKVINIDKKDNKGWTALMYASFNGQSDIVSMLIEKGADVNTRDNKGFSAFHIAHYNQHAEIVSMLQKKKKEIKDARPSLSLF